MNGNIIIFHASDPNPAFGEIVTISINDHSAVLTSRSVNEYYLNERQNELNASLFTDALVKIATQISENEKMKHPHTREKYGALIPSKTYLVTPVLIYLNILVFLLMVLSGISIFNPNTERLLQWGGNFRPLTTTGEWWRLFTCMFLHAGILHLLMNMFALAYIGMFLEPIMGRFRFLSAYLLTGVCSGLMSIYMHSFTVGVGASGAIFGMYGVFLATLTTKYIEKTARKTQLRSIMFFVLYNLLAGTEGNVDNAAHIGGLISGIVVGYAFYPGLVKQHQFFWQLLVSSVLGIMIFFLTVNTLKSLPNDMGVYDRKMKQFTESENRALQVLKPEKTDTKEMILNKIKIQGIDLWERDLQLLNDVKNLDIPAQMKERNLKLAQYCRLRIEQYNLFYKDVEGSGTDTAKIGEVNRKINQMISELIPN
jgi:rhomboid protease GluP